MCGECGGFAICSTLAFIIFKPGVWREGDRHRRVKFDRTPVFKSSFVFVDQTYGWIVWDYQLWKVFPLSDLVCFRKFRSAGLKRKHRWCMFTENAFNHLFNFFKNYVQVYIKTTTHRMPSQQQPKWVSLQMQELPIILLACSSKQWTNIVQ